MMGRDWWEGVGQLTNESLPLHSWDVPAGVRLDRHYEHAPIAEAIIELSCDVAADVTLEDLTHVVDRQVFTSEGSAVLISGRIEVGPDGIKGDTTGEQIGHLYRRTDGLRVIQSRLNGFAYSVLAPYDRWETFSAEAWEHWQVYRRVARPTKVSRLGVRFINKIDIPQASIEIKDYLRTAVDVSPYLPQVTASYFVQVVVPLLSFDASATITSTVLPPSSPDMTSLILDIDTWRLLDISLESNTEGERLREVLNDLRSAKNFVFEACITDATRGLIS
jgi:uncharacterized protein (TIGR04255 family)